VNKTIKIVECPRDAMQGLHKFIPTDKKIAYLTQLLKVGFHTLDCGSFVSPKAIPQMRDTKEVIAALDLSNTKTKLLTIVVNERGANDACKFDKITYLGYPFSISETFQLRNTNATIEESLERVQTIQDICLKNGKILVVYISMGFGNPYGDDWNLEIVQKWVNHLQMMGIKILSLSDTIGVATQESIEYLFSKLIPMYPDIEFGAHLHTRMDNWKPRIKSSLLNGCLRFDGAINGHGGCPMAKDDLTGNMPTENMAFYFESKGYETGINKEAFFDAMQMAQRIFPEKQ